MCARTFTRSSTLRYCLYCLHLCVTSIVLHQKKMAGTFRLSLRNILVTGSHFPTNTHMYTCACVVCEIHCSVQVQLHHIISRPITSHHITSHHITSPLTNLSRHINSIEPNLRRGYRVGVRVMVRVKVACITSGH